MQTYLVDRLNDQIASFLLDDHLKPLEIYMDDPTEQRQSGDIVVGRVMQVVWNIRAAFVDIGIGQNCYLPIDERVQLFYTRKGSSERIQQGDELIVQVERPAIKSKAPALTGALTLRGRYLLLNTTTQSPGVSRKIAEPRRGELRLLAEQLVQSAQQETSVPISVLLRTNASSVPDELIYEEFRTLLSRLQTIMSRAAYLTAGACLADAGAPWLQHLVDLQEDNTGQILIEDEELYTRAAAFLQLYHPELSTKISRYQDDLWPMHKKYELQGFVKAASHRRVWLRSGAYLIIEPTEALVSIDVNTGKIGPGKHKSDRQETFLKVNLEAAAEIARQIRLRNLSGIIIIDFINLEEEAHRQVLLDKFGYLLAQDPVPTRVVDMTKLGLVEVTRKKVRRSLSLDSEG